MPDAQTHGFTENVPFHSIYCDIRVCLSIAVTVTASNKVKSVSKILRFTISETKKHAENSSPSLEHEDTETLTPLTHNEAVNPNIYANDDMYMNFNGVALYEGCKIAARLPEISADIPGMYDFEITLSDDAQTGEELIYIANSSEPSDDDYIAEFYDDTGGNSKYPGKQENHSLNMAQEGDNICACSHCERKLNFKVRYTEKFDRMKKPV